ncbi:TPA: ead/Ea22-like family protein [Klebsiella pneumoniae]|nr:ead/Ea22-like family protein [Klebsiella pneumoniae]HBY2263121.1 ead/Ea22-like family protein [Klebsiella pneumoniae]HBY2296139.1 ead/Ea22-like family protein [Klebsiella pneumoniae]HBY2350474.1 ead/Ea22-like family protein [Klebsiella pneumoniae]
MTTDITELAPAMKAAAKKATPGPWALARNGKTVVSNQSHPIANVTDVMHRMLADGTTGQDAEFISLANPANILALVEALEKAQGMEAYWKTQCRGITDHCEELQARIAELEREQEQLRPVGVMSEKAFHRLENSECRFIALWPRPGIFLPRKRPEDGVIVYARTVATAGIKVEAE